MQLETLSNIKDSFDKLLLDPSIFNSPKHFSMILNANPKLPVFLPETFYQLIYGESADLQFVNRILSYFDYRRRRVRIEPDVANKLHGVKPYTAKLVIDREEWDESFVKNFRMNNKWEWELSERLSDILYEEMSFLLSESVIVGSSSRTFASLSKIRKVPRILLDNVGKFRQIKRDFFCEKLGLPSSIYSNSGQNARWILGGILQLIPNPNLRYLGWVLWLLDP